MFIKYRFIRAVVLLFFTVTTILTASAANATQSFCGYERRANAIVGFNPAAICHAPCKKDDIIQGAANSLPMHHKFCNKELGIRYFKDGNGTDLFNCFYNGEDNDSTAKVRMATMEQIRKFEDQWFVCKE